LRSFDTRSQTVSQFQALGLPTESRPIVKHVLSKEQQLYYEKMTDAINGCVVFVIRQPAFGGVGSERHLVLISWRCTLHQV
jgi:hypothetical protein